jgi:hypothetical protein
MSGVRVMRVQTIAVPAKHVIRVVLHLSAGKEVRLVEYLDIVTYM